jgi:hypothetical protein
MKRAESELLAIPDECIHQATDDHRGWLIEKGERFLDGERRAPFSSAYHRLYHENVGKVSKN